MTRVPIGRHAVRPWGVPSSPGAALTCESSPPNEHSARLNRPLPSDDVGSVRGSGGGASAADLPTREIRYRHSPDLPGPLDRLGVSLLVSTYQAGKVVSIGSHGGALTLGFANFTRPMGLALTPDGLAVADQAQVWRLRNAPEVARRLEPAGSHDACLLARSAHVTGEVQAHELATAGGELWLVNTAYSCLCTLDPDHSFVPRWRPPFVSALAAQDRCHLNGLAIDAGRPAFVTALGETDGPEGWRPGKAGGGVLIDVASGETVARGFAMPHSPRVRARSAARSCGSRTGPSPAPCRSRTSTRDPTHRTRGT